MASSVANSSGACLQLTRQQRRQNCPSWHPVICTQQGPQKKRHTYENANTRLQNRIIPRSPETHRVRFSWQSLAECLRSGGFTKSGVISSRRRGAQESPGSLLNTHKGSVTGVIEMCPSLRRPALFPPQHTPHDAGCMGVHTGYLRTSLPWVIIFTLLHVLRSQPPTRRDRQIYHSGGLLGCL